MEKELMKVETSQAEAYKRASKKACEEQSE